MHLNRSTRFLIDAPFHWWRLIVTITLLFALLGITLGSIAFRSYEAIAGVTTLRTRTQVSFDTGVQTLSEEELLMEDPVTQTNQMNRIDLAARRQTLVAMVDDAAIANKISMLPDIQPYLTKEDRQPGRLSAMVRGRLALNPGAERDQSDLIEIVVQHPNPEAAAAIANAWAREYERRVNEIYGTPASANGPTEPEVEVARLKYEGLQSHVIDFLRNSHKEEDEREVALLRSVLEQFQNARVDLLDALVKERQSIDAQLEHALLLYDQARAGADGTTMGIVIALEKMRLAGLGLPDQTQLSMSDLHEFVPRDLITETRAMVLALQVQQAIVNNAIRVQQQLSLNGILPPPTMPITASLLLSELKRLYPDMSANQSLTRILRYDPTLPMSEGLTRTTILTATRVPSVPAPATITLGNPLLVDVTPILLRVRELDAQIEREKMMLEDLTTQRNLAYDTYTMLARKHSEALIAGQIPGSEVRFSTLASIPTHPVYPIWTVLLIALALGSGVGIALGYLAEGLYNPEWQALQWGLLGRVLSRQPVSFTERLVARLWTGG